jgi:hypothetical protein
VGEIGMIVGGERAFWHCVTGGEGKISLSREGLRGDVGDQNDEERSVAVRSVVMVMIRGGIPVCGYGGWRGVCMAGHGEASGGCLSRRGMLSAPEPTQQRVAAS